MYPLIDTCKFIAFTQCRPTCMYVHCMYIVCTMCTIYTKCTIYIISTVFTICTVCMYTVYTIHVLYYMYYIVLYVLYTHCRLQFSLRAVNDDFAVLLKSLSVSATFY